MIFGIDVLLHMDKTVTNVTADLTIPCFMTKGEDKIDMKGNKNVSDERSVTRLVCLVNESWDRRIVFQGKCSEVL